MNVLLYQFLPTHIEHHFLDEYPEKYLQMVKNAT